MSTGIGFGIGIPHASTDLIYEVVGALGRSQKGVNFDALDNQPVKLVMLFLVPQGQFQKHLHTLANIAKLLHKADFRQALEAGARRRGHAHHHQGIREKMISGRTSSAALNVICSRPRSTRPTEILCRVAVSCIRDSWLNNFRAAA